MPGIRNSILQLPRSLLNNKKAGNICCRLFNYATATAMMQNTIKLTMVSNEHTLEEIT